jgi:sulfur carrier protein
VKIRVNGVWHDVVCSDVASVLKELGYGDSVVATALNGVFVSVGARPSARVSDADHLEILAPMQGG